MQRIIHYGQGFALHTDPELANAFVIWLESTPKHGRFGVPQDVKDCSADTGPMIYGLDCRLRWADQEPRARRSTSRNHILARKLSLVAEVAVENGAVAGRHRLRDGRHGWPAVCGWAFEFVISDSTGLNEQTYGTHGHAAIGYPVSHQPASLQ